MKINYEFYTWRELFSLFTVFIFIGILIGYGFAEYKNIRMDLIKKDLVSFQTNLKEIQNNHIDKFNNFISKDSKNILESLNKNNIIGNCKKIRNKENIVINGIEKINEKNLILISNSFKISKKILIKELDYSIEKNKIYFKITEEKENICYIYVKN